MAELRQLPEYVGRAGEHARCRARAAAAAAASRRRGKKLRADAQLRDEYDVGGAVGVGGFSEVQLVTERATRQVWACKSLPLPPPDAETKAERVARVNTMREINALLDLEHPNVVGMKEYFVEHNKVYLIMELLRGEAAHARARRWCAACAVASSVRAC